MVAGEMTDQLRAGSDSLPSVVLPEATRVAGGARKDALPREAGQKTDTSPSSKDINLSEFGISSKEKFEPPQELRTHFEGMMRIIADKLRQYQATGKPLAENQKIFLAVYEKLGSKMFDTADGWSLANLMIEQEMFLRLGLIGKNIIEEVKTKGKGFPQTPTGEVTLSREEVQGLVSKYGLDTLKYLGIGITAPLSLPILGIRRLRESANLHDLKEVKIKFTDFQIDLSQLPPEYKDYITYLGLLDSKDSPEHAQKFILEAQKARLGVDITQPEKGKKAEQFIGFYQCLGANPKDLEDVTPWQKFLGITGVRVAGENIETSWIAVRREAALEAAFRISGGTPLLEADAPKVFFEAQQKTIGHFLNLHLKAVVEAEFGKEGKGAATIKTLQDRVASMRAPQEVAKMKTKTEVDVAQLKTTIGEQKENLKTKQKLLTDKESEQLELIGTQKEDQREFRELNALDRMQHKEMGELIGLRSKLTTDINEQISASTDLQLKAFLTAQRGEREAYYSNLIAEQEKRLGDTAEKIVKAKLKLTKLPILNKQIRNLKGGPEIIAARGVSSEPAAPGEIKSLQDEINANEQKLKEKQEILDGGIEAAVQARIDRVEAVVGCLQDYNRVVSDPLFHPVEKMLTVQDLTSTVQKDEEGSYLEGYLRFMDHLFQYTNQVKRSESFETSVALLSPVELGTILRNRFGLTDAGGVMSVSTDIDLQKVFEALRAKNISQTRMASVFLNVLEFIEEKGKKIK